MSVESIGGEKDGAVKCIRQATVATTDLHSNRASNLSGGGSFAPSQSRTLSQARNDASQSQTRKCAAAHAALSLCSLMSVESIGGEKDGAVKCIRQATVATFFRAIAIAYLVSGKERC
jgi:hypothetical protein